MFGISGALFPLLNLEVDDSRVLHYAAGGCHADCIGRLRLPKEAVAGAAAGESESRKASGHKQKSQADSLSDLATGKTSLAQAEEWQQQSQGIGSIVTGGVCRHNRSCLYGECDGLCSSSTRN